MWIVYAVMSALCWGGSFAAFATAATSRTMCNWGRRKLKNLGITLGAAGMLLGALGTMLPLPSTRVLVAFIASETLVVVGFFLFLCWARPRIAYRSAIVRRAYRIKEYERLSQIKAALQQGILPNDLLDYDELVLVTTVLEAVGVKMIQRNTQT